MYADDPGKPVTVPRAVAIYERDGGVLWKHFEYYSDSNDSRRARELVVFSLVTVGNYDYGFNWIFRQDGTLEMQAVLTGIMLTQGVTETMQPTHDACGASGDHRRAGRPQSGTSSRPTSRRRTISTSSISGSISTSKGPANSVREINTRALPPGRRIPR